MSKASLIVFALTVGLVACSSNSSPSSTPVSFVRNYNGTASVGDFLIISIDSNAKAITYHNYTNGDTGTVPYSVNSDGTYTVTDPNGNLLAAYEVPGSLMMVESAKSGPTHDTVALITAVESAPANIGTFAGRNFNYVQFRTAAGGIEIGTVTVDAQGNIQHDSYWPHGELEQPQNFFNGGTFPASSVVEDASGNFFTINESAGAQDVVFGTQNGFFAVDTQNGTILGLPKASSKNFVPTMAGTYKALVYEKNNARTGQNNQESGTPAEDTGSVTITAGGVLTLADSHNHTLASGTLVPIADASYIYDGTANTLSDPCYGMFTIRIATATSQQDLFVSFQGNAVIFSSFETGLPLQPNGVYSYFYGVGLK
jgi:hypothetical protein